MFYKIVENEKMCKIGDSDILPENAIKLEPEEYEKLSSEIKAHAKSVREYFSKVESGEITIDEVPEEFLAEVQHMIDRKPDEPSNPYGLPDKKVQQIQDDTIANLINLGVL